MGLNGGFNTMGDTPTGERVDEGKKLNRVGTKSLPHPIIDIVNTTREKLGVPPIDSTKK